MAYEYDIFLSYTRRGPLGDWVNEYFLKFFEPFLENALGSANLFVDKKEIKSGDSWPERIKKALCKSKCMVAICSPAYFKSQWCVNEYRIMLNREKRLGYQTTENPKGLILPVVVFDGNNFPEFAQRKQHLDCRNFARVGQGFAKTERYVEFQDKIISWVEEVAKAVENAPPWEERWYTKEWLDDLISGTHSSSDTNFNLPTLG